MIIKGSQRSGGKRLAIHLLNLEDNDFVEVHELRGFLSEDVTAAFKELEAVAKGTLCKQPFFSVSLSPPQDASVPVGDFETAIERIERDNGLRNQPRAVIFHEKHGRRHAHVVWSRIDAQTMTAKNLSHYKRKLNAIAHDLFLENGWDVPKGFEDQAKANPTNVNLEEWQAAKRRGRNAIDQKALIQQCWQRADTRAAFEAALAEHGYALAQGDRRSHVIVTNDGQIIAVARAVGRKTKEVRAFLGSPEALPDVETARAALNSEMNTSFVEAAKAVRSDLKSKQARLDAVIAALIKRQRSERVQFDQRQSERHQAERESHGARLRSGLLGLWDRATGKRSRVHADIRRTAAAAQDRDQTERTDFITAQLKARRVLERERTQLRHKAMGLIEVIRSDRAQAFEALTGQPAPLRSPHREDRRPDPQQSLIPKPETHSVSKQAIQRDPAKILDLISHKQAYFTEVDVTRALAEHFRAPETLAAAKNAALASSNLVQTLEGLTTRDYLAAEATLTLSCGSLSERRDHGVSAQYLKAAIRSQNETLHKRFGAKLSDEQQKAIAHVTDQKGISCLVGLAGAGKSTILSAAHDAWRAQGVQVYGAALAGKAAEGLETASGMKSRTLASLELSWANGHQPIAEGDVLVIDEAGMIGTRQMARVANKISEIGAKLVLVGDPDQLPPIEAGEPFRDVIEKHGAARLTEIHRQKADWQRVATQALAEGRLEQATEAYSKQGGVVSKRRKAEAIEALVEDYLIDREVRGADASRLALAHRRRDVHELNQSIRDALKAEGNLSDGIMLKTETGQREIAPGERMVFTRNDRDIGVKNGSIGSVISASASKITVRLDSEDGDARKVRFDPRRFASFDHGYAVTIHKSQGATVDRSFVLASRSMDASLAYVAMTRHREGLKLYAARSDSPKWLSGLGQSQARKAVPAIGPELEF